MLGTPKGLRLHIGIFGRRNVGKSSLINALTGHAVSIVSATPGTTTDPVEKSFEMAPVGPVVFVDTGGVDDVGTLGELRKQRTAAILERVDVALLVRGPDGFGPYEEQLATELRERSTPTAVVFNKSDLGPPPRRRWCRYRRPRARISGCSRKRSPGWFPTSGWKSLRWSAT